MPDASIRERSCGMNPTLQGGRSADSRVREFFGPVDKSGYRSSLTFTSK